MIITSETEGYWCHTLENNITSNVRFRQSYLSKVKQLLRIKLIVKGVKKLQPFLNAYCSASMHATIMVRISF